MPIALRVISMRRTCGLRHARLSGMVGLIMPLPRQQDVCRRRRRTLTDARPRCRRSGQARNHYAVFDCWPALGWCDGRQ